MNFAESVKLTNTTNTTNLLPNSIYDLDAKKIIDFECNLSHKNILQTIIPHTICGTTFWEIDNFLQRDICDAVINKCEDVGFDSVDFRPIGRVICWDKSGGLVKTIEDMKGKAFYLPCREEIVTVVKNEAREGDLFVLAGAGNISLWANELPALLAKN